MKRSDYLRSITVQKNGSTFYTRSKMKPGFQIVAGDYAYRWLRLWLREDPASPRPTGERARAACRDDYDLGKASSPGFILEWVYTPATTRQRLGYIADDSFLLYNCPMSEQFPEHIIQMYQKRIHDTYLLLKKHMNHYHYTMRTAIKDSKQTSTNW